MKTYTLEKVIGEGIDMTNVFSPKTGGVNTNLLMERINQSIFTILSTFKGTRFMIPLFGSDLQKLVFEPNDFVLVDRVKVEVYDALSLWERRIKITNIVIDNTSDAVPDNTIFIIINYIVNKVNMEGSYVYPFVRDPYPF